MEPTTVDVRGDTRARKVICREYRRAEAKKYSRNNVNQISEARRHRADRVFQTRPR